MLEMLLFIGFNSVNPEDPEFLEFVIQCEQTYWNEKERRNITPK